MSPRPSPELTARTLLEAGLRRGGDREAVVDARRRLTFRTLDHRTARLANALRTLGCDPRRPAAALLGNRSEYIELDLAAVRAGVPRVGLGERLSPDEWEYILAQSEAVVLVLDARFAERVTALPDTLKTVLLVDGQDRSVRWGGANVRPYEDVLADASASAPPADARPDEPSFVMYTSGTTGRPKGAWLSHAGRAAAAANMAASELRVNPGAAMVHAGPLTHGSGSKVLLFAAAGGRNIVLERFEPELLARAVAEDAGTHTFLVPTMIQRLVDAPEPVRRDLLGLEQISFGGAPISPAAYRRGLHVFGDRLVQVYGSTEAPHPLTLLRPSDLPAVPPDELLMSAGYPTLSVEVRLVDADGAIVPAGSVGELQVRAPHLMSGYWNNAEATAEAFTDDGWYLSGDLATMDAEGMVTFRDRKKDLIISGGLNIYPSEVERVLLEHPGVAQAVVVGYPDDEWGESVLAFIVPRDEAVAADALNDWTRERLAGYKKPRRYEFRAELPTGASHKVLRNVLRQELWQDRSRGVN
jgi:acyl-CoA synthetase (AMP-forming)/AMP-acid ligase II